ncbi:unnamed protein product [Cuscuta campestris]|uniref:Uncharacterized protein n=1 Tax=Cuscuta campestris TaxID=132261 RepID=A0A484MBH9_9ASTE|nr:unnamed protein product [Cuscuta campestris]
MDSRDKESEEEIDLDPVSVSDDVPLKISDFADEVARVGHHISDSLGAKDSKDDEAIYKPYFTSFVGGVAKDHALGNNHQSLISILPCAIIMSHLPDIIKKECLVSTDATIHEIQLQRIFLYPQSGGILNNTWHTNHGCFTRQFYSWNHARALKTNDCIHYEALT